MKSQPRRRGLRRDPLPSYVAEAIHAKIATLARQHNVSRSWVVATILADALGVDIPGYDDPAPRRRRKP